MGVRTGFAPIELLVVVAVTAVLAAILLPVFGPTNESAVFMEAAAMSDAAVFDTPPDFFPIFPWSPLASCYGGGVEPEEAVAGLAECNFTMAGFVTPQDLPLCEKYGLKAIMYPGIVSRGEIKDQSDAEVEAAVREAVAAAGDSDAILGYHLIDEPGATLFPKLGVAVAAVGK
ncbi:MAG: hypothetical protein ACP5KN_10170, partial [Armatimonadota bacterium]